MKNLGILLFPEFEILDVFGPVEMYANASGKFNIILIAEQKGLIKSVQGVAVAVTEDFDSTLALDILMIPGGMGTRQQVYNQKLLDWIKKYAAKTELLLSVCTGAALLAKAGLLDHRKATSNKIAFSWVASQGPNVQWQKQARWVEDGNIITSSGIAAGIDMSLYVIEKLYGKEEAQKVAHFTEYVWNPSAENDPFKIE